MKSIKIGIKQIVFLAIVACMQISMPIKVVHAEAETGNHRVDFSNQEAEVIDITEDFTDINFRNQVCKVLGKKESESIYTTDDFESVSFLDVSNQNISSLSGIEHFTNLKVLYCYGNQLTDIHVERNVKLTHLDCSVNQIKELDVDALVDLKGLYCYENQLSEISIEHNKNLAYFDCSHNEIEKLSGDKNQKLVWMDYSYNQLSDVAY